MADSHRSRRSSKDVLRSMLSNLPHLNLTDEVQFDGRVLKAHGGFCDVFQGRWVSQGVSIYKVAIKRLRVHIRSDRDFAKQLAKEIRVWSKLSHRNILPLLGYVVEGDYPSLVSEWMENGTVSSYMRQHPETDILQMVLGIARGLEYLHDEGVIHSDIKADNVLVSRSGAPRICDFGISRMLAASQSFGETSTQATLRGSVRWMAPELLLVISGDAQAEHSMESDVWAFGMTTYELLTKQVPYSYLKRDMQVMFTIIKGIPPPCPEAYFFWPIYWQKLWSICVVSWNWYPALRKPMSEVVTYLEFLCRRSEEERFRVVESSIHEFEEPNTSNHRHPSILGQDETVISDESPQYVHSLPGQAIEVLQDHPDSPDTELSDEGYSKDSDSDDSLIVESSRASSFHEDVDKIQHVPRSETHLQRAPSLGRQDIIRDFDLRRSVPSAQDATSLQPVQTVELIKKWQAGLKPQPTTSTNGNAASTLVPVQNTSAFFSPHNAEIADPGGSRRSILSSAGSSTVGKNTRACTFTGVSSDLVAQPREDNRRNDMLGPAPNIQITPGRFQAKTLRRKTGTVSRM